MWPSGGRGFDGERPQARACVTRILLALAVVWPSWSWGSDSWTMAEIKQVEAFMGVYLVHSPRRHESERVQYRKGTVKIDVWHPVHSMTDREIKTRAVQWLVFGRTQYASGARGIFSEMKGVKQVVLRFHEVVRPRKNSRRRRGRERIKRFLALALKRRTFEGLDIQRLTRCVEQDDCTQEFNRLFTKRYFDTRYAAKRRREP